MKKRIFINYFHLWTSICCQIFVICIAYIICFVTAAVWYVQVIVYCGCIVITFFAFIMPILKFVVFLPGNLEVRDYRFFFRIKKTVIPTSSIKKVEITYLNKHKWDIIYYELNGERCELTVDNNYKQLMLFAEYMPDVKYLVKAVKGALIDPIPQSHREVLAKLNIINKEPF